MSRWLKLYNVHWRRKKKRKRKKYLKEEKREMEEKCVSERVYEWERLITSRDSRYRVFPSLSRVERRIFLWSSKVDGAETINVPFPEKIWRSALLSSCCRGVVIKTKYLDSHFSSIFFHFDHLAIHHQLQRNIIYISEESVARHRYLATSLSQNNLQYIITNVTQYSNSFLYALYL